MRSLSIGDGDDQGGGDRLARSVRGLAQILEDLDTAGVAFRSATEPFDTATPAGRMMVQMLGVFAEFERAAIIDRVIAGMERKAAKGGWTNGPPPYGYRINGDYLEPNPDEAPLVTAIFTRYTRGRHGAQAIARWLNDAGHRTRAGRRWIGRLRFAAAASIPAAGVTLDAAATNCVEDPATGFAARDAARMGSSTVSNRTALSLAGCCCLGWGVQPGGSATPPVTPAIWTAGFSRGSSKRSPCSTPPGGVAARPLWAHTGRGDRLRCEFRSERPGSVAVGAWTSGRWLSRLPGRAASHGSAAVADAKNG